MWDYVILFSKLLIYMGASAAIATPAFFIHRQLPVRYLAAVRRYASFGVVIGIVGALLLFLAQVAHFSERGVAGMFDRTYMPLLWSETPGDGLLYQLTGFVLLCFSLTPCWEVTVKSVKRRWDALHCWICWGAGGLLIGYTFALMGHMQALGAVEQMLLTVHVVAVFLWLGSLIPLRLCFRYLDVRQTQKIMRHFGRVAVAIVAVLALCGGAILYSMAAQNFTAFLASAYSRFLSVKLLLVAIMLLLAARHKWLLVPQLPQAGAMKLKHSITLESTVALGVFMVTVVLTTLVGI